MRNINIITILFSTFVLLFSVVLFSVNSCSQNVNNQTTHQLDSIGQDTIMNTQVLSFEYDGHKYIEFLREEHSYVTHDPNCTCIAKEISKQIANTANKINRNTDSKIQNLDNNNRKNFRLIIDKISNIDAHMRTVKQTSKPTNKKQIKTKK